jgi:gamma-glutamyltranspeptidase / glutathione hydrolase
MRQTLLAAGVLTALAAVSYGEPPRVFPHAAVAADHALASEAGARVLREGGNAVDAAVATSFALSVVRPYSCGIGGGGFMLIRLKDHRGGGPLTTAINYRETAFGAARPDYYEGLEASAATHGGKAVAVPGHVAGMLYALEKYWTMDRRRVLAPAIALAKEGFIADEHYEKSTQKDDLVVPWLKQDPARVARFRWLWERGLLEGAVRAGNRIHMPEQARVLELIAEKGAAGFYEGPVAEAIVWAVRGDGGEMTLADLAG